MGCGGGGSLEHPKQWLGTLCAGLFLRVHATQSRQARPKEAQEPSRGAAKGHFDHAALPVERGHARRVEWSRRRVAERLHG